jgi:hypothetical protein
MVKGRETPNILTIFIRKKKSRIDSLEIYGTANAHLPDLLKHSFDYFKELFGKGGTNWCNLNSIDWDSS